MQNISHIHILGICGTFMGGVALLARELGFTVSGSDAGVYPPMSMQLEAQGITLTAGYSADYFKTNKPDLVVIGNAMSRGNESVEYVLDQQINYCSGPEFVAEHILKKRWVLAVAGTHGKTTTSSMLSWILEYANMKPGFLIGGIPQNFGVSARLGDTPFFVIEADEYDTAFFDKRSKFVHYHPRTLVLNNLEFDHADIFDSLDDIKKQFHHLMRILPASGKVISFKNDANLNDVLDMGCWSESEKIDVENKSGWWANLAKEDGSIFEVGFNQQSLGTVHWNLIGDHNVNNAIAAIAAARHVGVAPEHSIDALGEYINTKRRLEVRGTVNDITVYDDFAHHPTAINLTLDGLRKNVGDAKIFAILEPRSNTMKMGVHKDSLAASLQKANSTLLFQSSDVSWDLNENMKSLTDKVKVYDSTDEIITTILKEASPGDHILIMSNGGFENIHQRLLDALADKNKANA
ncbi:MAG: UDP-N-acetylmuramate:L-alanyl-gamma-D-glutamyl-meso-diaminopimelate ligase [Gammaproteobacteria bacterium]|nr:UDP-N-acetylmuramate:L-alanyl-gamma-D-glutamyl-meso-diaminopimelate ligase [Gammaproteobacteria bacterium]